MNIFIDKCIKCCMECNKFKHFQYNLDVEDYDFDFSKKKYSNKLNKTFSSTNPIAQNSMAQNSINFSNDIIIDVDLLQTDYGDFEVIDSDKSE